MAENKIERIENGNPQVKPAFGKKAIGTEGKSYPEKPAIVKITDKKKGE